jgi:hypothetical protein
VPALQASRLNLSDALKQGGAKATVSRTSTQLRSGVVAEVALSVILLATAGLLVRSFQALQHVDRSVHRLDVPARRTDLSHRR